MSTIKLRDIYSVAISLGSYAFVLLIGVSVEHFQLLRMWFYADRSCPILFPFAS